MGGTDCASPLPAVVPQDRQVSPQLHLAINPGGCAGTSRCSLHYAFQGLSAIPRLSRGTYARDSQHHQTQIFRDLPTSPSDWPPAIEDSPARSE